MDWLKEFREIFHRGDHENHDSAEEPVTTVDQTDDDEIIAVISAAIAASLNRSTNEVIVRSIRRVPSVAPVWNQVARQELTTRRL